MLDPNSYADILDYENPNFANQENPNYNDNFGAAHTHSFAPPTLSFDSSHSSHSFDSSHSFASPAHSLAPPARSFIDDHTSNSRNHMSNDERNDDMDRRPKHYRSEA